MRTAKILALLLGALVTINVWWRRQSRRRSLPCPTWLAGSLASPLADRVIGTQETLDRMGLQPGQRVLEVGPGPGRLLIPAAWRVLPGGEVVGQGDRQRRPRQVADQVPAGVQFDGLVFGELLTHDAQCGRYTGFRFDPVSMLPIHAGQRVHAR